MKFELVNIVVVSIFIELFLSTKSKLLKEFYDKRNKFKESLREGEDENHLLPLLIDIFFLF